MLLKQPVKELKSGQQQKSHPGVALPTFLILKFKFHHVKVKLIRPKRKVFYHSTKKACQPRWAILVSHSRDILQEDFFRPIISPRAQFESTFEHLSRLLVGAQSTNDSKKLPC